MIKLFLLKASRLIATASLIFGALCVVGTITTASVSAGSFYEDVCKYSGANKSPACSEKGTNTITGPNGILTKATNVIALLSGIAAVFMIILGSFTMVNSSGDSAKTQEARKTITYSVVGLVVIVLARAIILFVLSKFSE